MEVLYFQTIGKKSLQEDSFFISSDQKLFVVCDGVGGRDKGEVASSFIVKSIGDQYETQKDTIETIDDISEIIGNSIIELNKFAHENPLLNGISTTLALLYIVGDYGYTAHLGDSRVIMLNQISNEVWSTKDHSVVQELFDAGVLKSEKEMQVHPLRNRITNAIIAGRDNRLQVCLQKTPIVNDKDVFIICSDGLLENYTNDDLKELLLAENLTNNFDEIKDKCIHHSRDNTTVILYRN